MAPWWLRVEKRRCSGRGAVSILAPMIAQEDERDQGGQDLATSTLAEIYAQQGLLERARAIYERIAQRSPDDPRIAKRIETLTRAIRERGRASTPEPVAADRHDPPAEVEDRPARDEEAGNEVARDEVFEAWLASR
ncbi:MAG: tetratricopeptide repeat protein [Gemmatimonadota bacterium]